MREGERRRRKKMDLQLIPKASRVGVNLYCATFTHFLENRPVALSAEGILGGWGVGGGGGEEEKDWSSTGT